MHRKHLNLFVAIWLIAYSTLCYAQSTLAQDMAAYDWASLLVAFLAGLVGGAARTILTLVSDEQLVGNVRLVLLKDMVVAIIGGAAAFLFIQGYNTFFAGLTAFLPHVTRDFRVLLIVMAGASRGRWLGIADKLATDAIANASHKLRGRGGHGGPRDPFVASAAAPLEPTK